MFRVVLCAYQNLYISGSSVLPLRSGPNCRNLLSIPSYPNLRDCSLKGPIYGFEATKYEALDKTSTGELKQKAHMEDCTTHQPPGGSNLLSLDHD